MTDGGAVIDVAPFPAPDAAPRGLVLLPVAQLEALEGGAWRATGSDPAFEAVLAEGRLSPGWYRVTLTVDVASGVVHAPMLYPDYGTGEDERDSIVLPVDCHRAGTCSVTRLVEFRQPVVRLRFDPSLLPAEFSVQLDVARATRAAGWLAALRGRARTRPRPLPDVVDYALDPLWQVEPTADGRWYATGGDPAFAVRLPGGRLAAGWYRLDLEAQVETGALHTPMLYPDYGQGGGEDGTVVLPLYGAGRGRHAFRRMVRFADDVQALRFDPSLLPALFSMGFRMARLGRRAALRALLAPAWAKRAPGARAQLAWTMATAAARGGIDAVLDLLHADDVAPPARIVHIDYGHWLDFHDDTSDAAIALARQRVAELPERPLVSVLVPVHDTPEPWLRRCIESVRRQAWPEWELCIADDASTAPHVREVLDGYAAMDPRIRVTRRERNGHISAASNTALAMARGRYVALLDHDDELHPMALSECMAALAANPAWRMVFTDEDKIDGDGVRSDPYFKPDWNPDLVMVQNCVCHLSVFERDLLEEVGGFREGYDGAQDWDLVLRIGALLPTTAIGHVPRVLYHWRMVPGSTALGAGEKTYAHFAARRAVESRLAADGERAEVEDLEGRPGFFRLRRALPDPAPMASLLIPTRDRVDLLRMCVESILARTDYPDYEIVILDNGSVEDGTHRFFEEATRDARVRVERYDHPFNYSAINNFGAGRARGGLLALVNNDIEVIGPDWLTEMASHACRREIGAVGAMLYYPDDRIQHAGVILGTGGVAGHCYVGRHRGFGGDKFRAGLVQNLSAVTAACLVVRADVFHEVGGLDEGLQVAFNDVDFCLRVREAGYRNLWTPHAELYHHESASRGYEDSPEKVARFGREVHFMQARWGDVLRDDPAYNPNFALDAEPFTLAFPPRVPLRAGIRRMPAGVAA